MDPHLRATQLNEAFELIRQNPRPTPSYLIGTQILDLKLRDKRQMRRAVRRLLSQDNRFQEVHAGLWETLNHDYGSQDLDAAEFRVLDLEVTGSDPRRNAIIDLAVFRVCGEKVRPLFSSLVDPEVPIPGTIQRLTGISDEMVRGGPTFTQILPELLQALQEGVFVAHNAAFDYHFLKTWIERITGTNFTAPHICTVKLSQRLVETKTGGRKLHHLARQFGIPLKNRHRAYDDAYATARVLVELKRRLLARNVTTVGEMKLFESGLPAATDTANLRATHGEPGAADVV
jgi:DNA polymerase III subunit alpha, Gram-positive type